MEELLDYGDFVKKQEKYLIELKSSKLIVSFSGGKDSTVILHYLEKAQKDFGFSIEAHGVTTPIHVFSDDEKAKLSNYWDKRGIEIVWHSIGKKDDKELSSLFKNGESPCVRCGQYKKAKLFEYLKERENELSDISVVVGYNLWDLSSALIEHILRAEFGGGEGGNFQGKKITDRFLEISQRFYPLIKMENGLQVYKPLIFYNDNDIEKVIEKEKLPVSETACRFAKFRPKRLLSDYYKLYQLDFEYSKLFEFAGTKLNLPGIKLYEKSNIDEFINSYI